MDISTFTHQLNEAEMLLRFSLYLTPASSTSACVVGNSLPQWIDRISDITFESCSELFRSGGSSFFGRIKNAPANRTDLTFLEQERGYELVWKIMLKQYCILSSYVKLRQLIGLSNSLTAYKAYKYNHYLSPYSTTGLDYLLNRNHLKLAPSANSISICEPTGNKTINLNSCCNISKYSSYYHRKLLKTTTVFGELSNLSPQIFNNSNCQILSSSLGLAEVLQGNLKTLRSILCGYKITENRKWNTKEYKNYCKGHQNLVNKSYNETSIFAWSDRIYLAHQLEELFNFNMIDCLFQNIVRAGVNNNIDLTSQAEIAVLSSCLYFPNMFSRQYLVQMAFDFLSYDCDQADTFYNWYSNFNTLVSFKSSATDIIDKPEKLSNWIVLYKKFVRYLTSFVFPIYENYFFISLYKDCKTVYTGQSEAELLVTLYLKLSEYLNSETIFNEFLCSDVKLITYAGNKSFDEGCIIKPNFNVNISPEYVRIYRRCLLAANNIASTKKDNFFISLDYLNTLTDKPRKHILAYYINAASSPKKS